MEIQQYPSFSTALFLTSCHTQKHNLFSPFFLRTKGPSVFLILYALSSTDPVLRRKWIRIIINDLNPYFMICFSPYLCQELDQDPYLIAILGSGLDLWQKHDQNPLLWKVPDQDPLLSQGMYQETLYMSRIGSISLSMASTGSFILYMSCKNLIQGQKYDKNRLCIPGTGSNPASMARSGLEFLSKARTD